MVRFTAMFVPTLLSLSKGMLPFTWTVVTDGGDAARDQVLQRATYHAATTIGFDVTVFAPQADAAPGQPVVDLFANPTDDTPVGAVSWVETIELPAAG